MEVRPRVGGVGRSPPALVCPAPVSSRSSQTSGSLHPSGALAARLERPPGRLVLATLPTPIEPAPWLAGPGGDVWIKRDDRSSAIYGGGKVRKLEWVLANPPFSGEQPIVSVGGIGSHHLLALALFLAAQHRSLHALTFVTTPTAHIRQNLAAMLSLGVRFWPVTTRLGLPRAVWNYYVAQRPETRGVWMGAGASSALGCFGFAEAGFELAEQIRRGVVPSPDRIFVAAGSAGTAAGLALGLALAGVAVELRLVSSVEGWAFNRWMLGRKIGEAWSVMRRCGIAGPASPRRLLAEAGVRIVVDHAEVGGGYGVPTDAAAFEVAAAREHGVAFETTYTGKCAAAVRRWTAQRRARPECVLFWNTHASTDLASIIRPGWENACPFPVPPEVGTAGSPP